ncbi:hypothetical protein KHM83_19030 [Fusibacter paucivorans]|uniref:Uncharacterized protein n=1 Tax=Fusibacter paucivorans TaxID=76009 RepID=A0ABS5PUC1_9FIRM|nr:hypothetical protein [Fusibacter paucivorans]MBS7528764.1 hypothetical protein [Fusibacter paucivorans]
MKKRTLIMALFIRPWAIVSFDSMPYGGWDEDGIRYMYGNPLQIQLFTKETN